MGTLAEEIARIDELLEAQRAGNFTIEHAVEQFMRERSASAGPRWAERYKQLCVEMVDSFVIPQPGVRSMLQQLRDRGIRVAILTNGWSPLQQRKAQRVQFEGPIVVSADIGTQKPKPQAFAALADALRVPPHEIAYVGDAPSSDAAGALAAGMGAVWFDADRIAYPKDLPPPSAVIHSLTELLSLV